MPKHEKPNSVSGESGEDRVARDNQGQAMERFKSLIKNIINVPREAINEQERIYNEEKSARKTIKRGKS